MTRSSAFRWVLLAVALALLSACTNDSGKWVEWAGKEVYLPAGYELGKSGYGQQRVLKDGQHREDGPLFTWVEVVEVGTGDVVGTLKCEQFTCLRSPLVSWLWDDAYDDVMRQIAESARGPFDDCDPLKESCEGE